jgi:predicted lipid-binding transport protein (Tim44 family)
VNTSCIREINFVFDKKEDAEDVIKNASQDPMWNRHRLVKICKTTFLELQKYWSINDIQNSLKYLHPSFRDQYVLKIKENINQNRRNLITNVKISEIEFMHAGNYQDDDDDFLIVKFYGSLDDSFYDLNHKLIEHNGRKKKQSILLGSRTVSNREINEYWTFKRVNNQWLVSDISKDISALEDVLSVDEEHVDVQKWIEERSQKRNQVAFKANFGCLLIVFFFFLLILILKILY